MDLFSNPLGNPILLPVVTRLAAILGAGFALVLLFNLRRPKLMFQSETWKRYQAWLLMAPTFMISVFVGGVVAAAFFCMLMLTASREYWTMLGLPHFYRRILVINCLISLGFGMFFPQHLETLPLIYLLITVSSAILRNRLEFTFDNICKTFFGSIWIPFCLSHLLLFRTLENGTVLLLTVGFSVALSDVMAFCIGKLFAKIKFGTSRTIASRMSPNKTWAGVMGNIAGATIGVSVFTALAVELSPIKLIIAGAAIGVGSVLGDLTESMIKRHAGVKDTSQAIPGHGGVLDRLDSLLVVVVVAYHVFRVAL